MTELYERYRRMHEKYLEGAPGAKKALNKIIKTLKENKRNQEEIRKKNEIFEKALNNHLDRLFALPILLRADESNEAKDHLIRKAVKTGEIIDYFQKLMVLDGISKEQLKKDSEYLNLEEIARTHIIKNQDYIKEEKLGLYFRYNKLSDE